MGSENYVSSGDPRWRVDVRLSPVGPPGSCGIHLRMSCRKLGLATLEEGRRRGSILVGPPKPAGVAGKPASSGDGVRHRGRIMAENGGSRRAPTT